MKCKNCKKEMRKWGQIMCYYACCINKKCKFEGLVKIYNFDDSEKQSNELKKMGSKQKLKGASNDN